MSCNFQDVWLRDARFADWLRKKDSKSGWCSLCDKPIPVELLGITAITRHHSGKKHKERLPVDQPSSSTNLDASSSGSSIKNFFQASDSSSASTSKQDDTSTHVEKENLQKKQVSITSMLEHDLIIDAEIRLSLIKIENKLSLRSIDSFANAFPVMFPDSDIAKGMKMKKDKCSYVIKHAVAPYCENLLLEQVRLSPLYALSFDESTNKNIQQGQMDIIVRFWDIEKNQVQCRYLTSGFMGEAKADDILETFNTAVSKKLNNPENLVQLGSDGPNVNLLFLKEYDTQRSFNGLPPLLDIGTCGLHTVHGSMKAGEKATKWDVGKTLKAMDGLLGDYPARRTKYERLTESSSYPLPYCGHRWCENERCLERAGEIWTKFIKFVKYMEKLPKSKQPGKGEGKQFLLLRKTVDDPLMPAKMKLLEYVSSLLNEFLRGFQTDQPMVPFLCETLSSLIRTIMNMYINSSVMKKHDSIQKLLQIDASDRNNFKQKDLTDVGIGAKMLISAYKSSSSYKQSKLAEYYSGAQTFLSTLVAHMMEKSPLAQPFARMVSSMNPKMMIKKSKRETVVVLFSKALEKMTKTGRLTEKEGNDANRQFSTFLSEVVDNNKEKFLAFDKFGDRLEVFFMQFMINKEYEAMWKAFKIVFIMFHGQAAIERGFNVNKMTSVVNQLDVTLTSLRMVDDHLKAHDVSAATFPITTELRKMVASSRRKAHEKAKQQDQNNKVTEKQLKRKIVGEEIEAVLKKKLFLEAAIEGLASDRDKLAQQAAENKDFQLLERSNDLRATIEKKREEIQECEKMEKELVLRRESIL